STFRTARTIGLGSKSPRRRQLLENLGLEFELCSGDAEELDGSSGLSPKELTMENAIRKLHVVKESCNSQVVLCADTCVYCQGRILGKPKDFEDARSMLGFLSGKWHEVFTSFVVFDKSQQAQMEKTVTSRVFLDAIDTRVIDAYCGTEEPYDKAGAYAVQGAGAFLVRKIEGSYTNVVGLPITEVVEALLKVGAIEPCVKD
ncbi:MAG: septum formation protein Maf, partial [Thermodesulfobacteria bacterium]|nr:septum formation protein Maf [Thermodesulfobacteriota bacterium]